MAGYDFPYSLFVLCFLCFLGSMAVLSVPLQGEREQIQRSFAYDLASYTYLDKNDKLQPVVCCVCDSQPSSPQWADWIPVNELAHLCQCAKMAKNNLRDIYSPEILQCYTAKHSRLEDYVLSPNAQFNNEGDSIQICKQCATELKDIARRKRKSRRPPILSIANGYLVGDPPAVLRELNPVELALVSRVRIYSQSWIFFGGCHKHIKGWHTFFRNRHLSNIANLNLLSESMQGNIMVVLCGPFTKTQVAMAREAVMVRPKKVVAAFEWLKQHNYHYKDDMIPKEAELPVPVVIDSEMYVSHDASIVQYCRLLTYMSILESTGNWKTA